MTLSEVAWRALLYWLLLPAVGVPVSIAAARMGHRGFVERLAGWFIIVPLALGASFMGPWPFFALVAGCCAVACWELARLGHDAGPRAFAWRVAVALAVSVPWIVWAQIGAHYPAWAAVVALFVPALVYGRRDGSTAPPWSVVPLALSLGTALSFWILLERSPGGFRFVLFAFTVVVVNDIMGFTAGKLLPAGRLLPRVSPHKTLTGYLGGAVSAILISVAFAFAVPEFGIADLLVAGVLLVGCGSLGDLAASAIKRRHAVKDFGTALGSHGGILDRLDSLLGSGWAFYVFLRLTQL